VCEEEEVKKRRGEEGERRGEERREEGRGEEEEGVHERRHRLIPTLCGVRPGSRGTEEVGGEYPTCVGTTRGT
jgi:hypothetical protein